MSGLRWDEVKHWFDPAFNGLRPDVRVADTSVAHWSAVVELARSRGWACLYHEDTYGFPVPEPVERMFARASRASVVLTVSPAPGMNANFWPRRADEMRFDVDVRSIQGQEQLDLFCEFLSAIGRRLGKPVLMSPEGFDVEPVLGYQISADRVVVLPSVVSNPPV
jgi:hypothetical protein